MLDKGKKNKEFNAILKFHCDSFSDFKSKIRK